MRVRVGLTYQWIQIVVGCPENSPIICLVKCVLCRTLLHNGPHENQKNLRLSPLPTPHNFFLFSFFLSLNFFFTSRTEKIERKSFFM